MMNTMIQAGMARMRALVALMGPVALLMGGGPARAHDHAHAGTGEAEVRYVPNQGQWPSAVRFKASFPTSAMFLQADGVTWSRYQDDAADLMHEYIQWDPERQQAFMLRGHAWRMRFVEGNRAAAIRGGEPHSAHHNYYLGNDPSKWATRVPLYGAVRYSEVWPGIDMLWHSEGASVKYDLLVAAGADHARIAFRYEGLDGVSIDAGGNLVLRTSVGEMTEMRPVAWYADDRSPLACAFSLTGDVVGFSFPQGVEEGRPFVIDPVLMGATYSGQVGASNYGHCSTFDAEGNIYGGAQNFGAGFPSSLGAFQASPAGGSGTDIVVNKFSPDATELLYATYIGGTGDDKPHSMIVNASGGLCVLGSTTSPDFPVTAGAFDATANGGSDIAVFHLSADATALVGSTYLGGAGQDGRQTMTVNYGDTYRGEVMVDPAGNIYIASATQSADYPVASGAIQPALAGAQDAVVTGLDPTCSTLLMSTYLGGAAGDNGLGLRLDGGGIYVCGGTMSSDFPMSGSGYQPAYQGGGRDGYIVKLSLDGSALLAGTYFGTSGDDMAYFIELDNESDVYIYGQSNGAIPIAPAGIYGQPNGSIFIASFDPGLTTPVFTTKLGSQGGSGQMLAPVAFLVDVCNRIYISGYNPNGTWETTPDALYGPGSSRFYLACYDVDMAGLLFGSYYGGSHVDGGTSRFDKRGVIYQGVCSGGQSMPTTPGSYAPTNNVGWDLGVFKIDFEQSGVNVDLSASATTGCAPATITFNGSSNATELVWDLGDGTVVNGGTQFVHTYTEPGTYQVMLIGTDSTSCNIADTMFISVLITDPAQLEALFTADPVSSCTAYGVQLTNQSTGSSIVLWDLGGTPSNQPNPYVTLSGPGSYSYTITVIDQACQVSDSYSMTVEVPPATLEIDLPSPVYLCPGGTVMLDGGPGFDGYAWSTGETAQMITVAEPGQYALSVELGFCDAADDVQVVPVAPPQGMADVQTCPGRPVMLAPSFEPQSIAWSTGETDETISVSGDGAYSFISTDGFGCLFQDTVVVSYLATSSGQAFIPNVFTPNGDGVNDTFEVAGLGVQQFSMEVFNRWGQLMYRTADSTKGWKGNLENAADAPVPDGTYYYIISYKDACADEPEVSKAGHVTLLR